MADYARNWEYSGQKYKYQPYPVDFIFSGKKENKANNETNVQL